jgi:NADH dehydrogenase
MQGLVTVFGGSGFVGAALVKALARRGWRIRVAVRSPHLANFLYPLGDVGQIQVVRANVAVKESVERALDGAEACINLVGILYETGSRRFQRVHVDGARNVAEACAARGIRRLVQVSALGADSGSPSAYARTKAEGEAAVRRLVPTATIVRPSVVFGPEDDFFNRFARMAVRAPALPLIGGGKTRFQPVYVGDVARAIALCAEDAATAGRTYELVGPTAYSFKELMQIVLRETGRRRLLLPVPFAVASLIGTVGDLAAFLLPAAPPLTSDQVRQLRRDNVPAAGSEGLAALGVEPTAVEAIVPTYLWLYRRGGQFAETAAQVQHP